MRPPSPPGPPRSRPTPPGGPDPGWPPATAPLPLAVAVRPADVRHFLGYPRERRPPARISRLIDDLLPVARGLLAARGAYRRLPVAAAAAVGLPPLPATGLVIGLVTIGAGLEERVARLLARDEAVAALVLDAIGSAAIEEAADRIGALVAGEVGPSPDETGEPAAGDRAAADAVPGDPAAAAAETSGAAPAPSCRISPGYGEWPLTAQPDLLGLLPCRELGVALLPSLLMVPRKSISFAMWLGGDARPLAGLSGCSRCPLRACRYRRRSRSEEVRP